MENAAHDLFLLTTNLSQLKTKDRIIHLFIESINTIFSNRKFVWHTEKEKSPNPNFTVCTLTRTFGFIHFDKSLLKDQESYALLQNAVQLLAIMLERLEQEALLTDRKKAEETLSKSERRAKALLDAIPDMMFRINRDGIYLDYKAQKEDLYYQSESLIGKRNRDLTPPEFADLIDQKIRETLEYGKMEIFEYQLAVPGKGLRIFEARMVVSGPDEVTAISQDITDRKKAENELKLKNEQLLETNSEKDKFFSIIAHDLRSPFNSFLGFTQMMAEEMNTLTLDQLQKIAQNMRKSATNLYNLLENLLEWSRLQRGITELHPESFPLKRKIEESMELVLESARKKKIRISYDIPVDLRIFADIHMFETVIRNLVSNAVKYTPKGGNVTIGSKSMDGIIEISVKDTGIGIGQEALSNLFRLDQNTNRPGTDGEPSTGLGLIICREFVEKHGGKIWAESEEGKGSTFRFTLPNHNQ